MTPHFAWYLARASGLAAWIAAGAAIAIGLVLAGRVTARPKPVWQDDLHRFVGALTVVLLGVHIGALIADSTVDFGLRAVALPLGSAWRPGAVTWGVVAAYLLVAVELSSLMRRLLPRRIWHGIHLTSFMVWIAGSVHAWQAGHDVTPVRVIALAGTAVLLNLTVLRIVSRRFPRARASTRSVAAS